jgi:DnaJ-class molecular chaperone
MDYYNTLGINKDATPEDIKKAYRSLASKHHPDKGGDTATFQKVQEAYATLSDPQKRAAYDNPSPFGQNSNGGWQQANAGVPPGFEQFFSQFGPDLGAMFGHHFNPRSQKNRSINLQTEISLEEAYTGKTVIANYRLPTGSEKSFEVKIPAGVQNGMTLRIAGAGDDSIRQLPPGDAMLTITVRSHHVFERNGNDLIQQIELSAWDAILGRDLEIETIGKDRLTIRIREGTQPDAVLRIQGHGMPDVHNPSIKGNHMLIIKINIPSNLTEYQKNTIRSILP